MAKQSFKTEEQWTGDWMDSVANGSNTMSSRQVLSIEKRGGGLKKVTSAARKRKVHLVLFEDDKGRAVVAASTKPFKVLA